MPLTVPSYFLSTAVNRVIGANSGANQSGNGVFFGGNGAGDDNSANNVIGIGVDAAAQNAAADIVVIGNTNRAGLTAAANGSIIIGHRILAAIADAADINSTVAIGADAMGNMIPTGGIGESVVIGTRAMQGGTTGAIGGANPDRMVIIGYEAGRFVNRDGNAMDANTFIGYQAGRGSNAASAYQPLSCVFIGSEAGLLKSGSNNVAVGVGAMDGAGTGSDNVAIGHSAGSNIGAGRDNVCVGQGSSTGAGADENVVIGANASPAAGGGARNIAIGFGAGFSSSSANGSILIGATAGSNVAAVSRRFVLENGLAGTPTPYLYGELDNGNLTLGNLASAGVPTGRVFGTGAVNTFKLQYGTVPSTGPTNGVSLIAVDNAGTIELRVIGPTGVSQLLATGL